jgi:hypothetical protein
MHWRLDMKESVLICAFRYALGRMTYVVSDVADCIEAQAISSEGLSTGARKVIVNEINEAIEEDALGMDMDAQKWIKLRDLLSANSNERNAPKSLTEPLNR